VLLNVHFLGISARFLRLGLLWANPTQRPTRPRPFRQPSLAEYVPTEFEDQTHSAVLASSSLISTGQMWDAGCTITFTATEVTETVNDAIVLTGHRTPDTRL
jgi:hypothetical protein